MSIRSKPEGLWQTVCFSASTTILLNERKGRLRIKSAHKFGTMMALQEREDQEEFKDVSENSTNLDKTKGFAAEDPSKAKNHMT
jgi:hypothetical protein